MKTIKCIESGRTTKITLTGNEWDDDDTLDSAANKLLKRETEHKHDFVCISTDKMESEICHALTGLTEHTGEYRTFIIEED